MPNHNEMIHSLAPDKTYRKDTPGRGEPLYCTLKRNERNKIKILLRLMWIYATIFISRTNYRDTMAIRVIPVGSLVTIQYIIIKRLRKSDFRIAQSY